MIDCICFLGYFVPPGTCPSMHGGKYEYKEASISIRGLFEEGHIFFCTWLFNFVHLYLHFYFFFILLFCMLFLSDCSLSDPLLHVMGTLAFPYEWPAWHCSNITELEICFIMWLNAVSSNAVFCKSRNILQTFTKQCKQPQVFCQSMGLFFPFNKKSLEDV